MKKIVFTITLFSTLLSSASANYCAGIRGNGELALAHWSAMARVIEHKGMPETVAGGSSAAVTMMLLDALSRNHLLSEDQTLKNKEQALLLKTMTPHMMYLFNKDGKAPEIMRIMGRISGMKDGGFFHKVKNALLIAKDADEFFEMLGKYHALFNPDLALGLRQNWSFYKAQAMEGVKVFGAFDSTDPNLFYRRGLVDFKFLGMLFGRMADFYAGYANKKTNKALKKFTNTCGEYSFGKTWYEIKDEHPECDKLLNEAFDRYYEFPLITSKYRQGGREKTRSYRASKRVFPNKMIFEQIGSGLNVLPTTSMVKGEAVQRYLDNIAAYENSEGTNVLPYTVDYDNELNYVYWGRSEVLSKVGANLPVLFPNDLKSSKFKAFEGGNWFEVMATSPAEPGLARLKRFPYGAKIKPEKVINKKYFKRWLFGWLPTLTAIPWVNEEDPKKNIIPVRDNVFSAGGWSDLHPSLVLRASGCEDVMYLTRQDGETVFGQQIFIRLTGYVDTIKFWRKIKDNNRKGWFNLDPKITSSPWNGLYNLGNPESSFNRSIQEADSVYCTNWNSFNVFKGELREAIEDAWHAPVFLKDQSRRSEFSFAGSYHGKSVDGFPGCIYQH